MEILEKYEKHLSVYYFDSTKEVYLSEVKRYLEFLERYKGKANSVIQICNVDRKDILNYFASVSNLSKGTIKIKLYAIKSFYSFLNADLSNFLFSNIKLFNTSKKLPKYLTSGEITRLLNYYSGEKFNLIYLFLNLGIRLAEMERLKIQDISLEQKQFTVIQKGGTKRVVYFNEETKQVFKNQISGRQNGNLFNYSRRQIQHIISYAMKKSGISGSVHTLRHTFATYMYKQTKDILLVKELLGHKSVLSTQIYTHIDNNEIRKAFESNPLASFKKGVGE